MTDDRWCYTTVNSSMSHSGLIYLCKTLQTQTETFASYTDRHTLLFIDLTFSPSETAVKTSREKNEVTDFGTDYILLGWIRLSRKCQGLVSYFTPKTKNNNNKKQNKQKIYISVNHLYNIMFTTCLIKNLIDLYFLIALIRHMHLARSVLFDRSG